MLKHSGKREPSLTTELTWEEKNPIDYLFGPSDEDLEWLENKIKSDEENILKKIQQGRNKKRKK